MRTLEVIDRRGFYNLVEKVFNLAKFPERFSNFSKKTYGNFNHIFLLLYKSRLNLSGRRFEKIASELGLQRILCIKKIPNHSASSRFLKKVDKELLRLMTQACAILLDLVDSKAIIDSTGFSLTNPSFHYVKRMKKKNGEETVKVKNYVKTSLIVDAKTKIVLNVDHSLKDRHDVNFFKPLLEELRLKVLQINADKGYDAEYCYHYCFDHGIIPMISMKEYKQSANGYGLEKNIAKGWFRKKAEKLFDERLYHQRSLIESVNHSIKATFGSFIRSKLPENQEKEATIKTIVYNLERIDGLLKIEIWIN